MTSHSDDERLAERREFWRGTTDACNETFLLRLLDTARRERDEALMEASKQRGIANHESGTIERLEIEARNLQQNLDAARDECERLKADNELLQTQITALEIRRDRLRAALESAPEPTVWSVDVDHADLLHCLQTYNKLWTDWYDTTRALLK
jgi:PAS domain-containing protein